MSEQNKHLNKIPENIDDKLFKVKYTCDSESHIKPDFEKCKTCKSKICTIICPAKVYEWDEEKQKLFVGFENCLECGACRIGCEKKCIDWKHPKAGFGVTFKNS